MEWGAMPAAIALAAGYATLTAMLDGYRARRRVAVRARSLPDTAVGATASAPSSTDPATLVDVLGKSA